MAVRAIGRLRAGGGLWGGLSTARALIDVGASDVNLLVIGDSTGNDVNEWAYLFADWLVDRHPTHTVKYALWTDGTNSYPAATTLGTGSGARTITVWNASISGSQPEYLMGSKYAASIEAVSPDVVIWNHGKNIMNRTASVTVGRFAGPMDKVLESFPDTPHVFLAQCPNRDDNNYAAVFEAMGALASLRGDVSVIDGYSPFIAQNKDSSLYADNIHPSAAGSLLTLAAVQSAWNRSVAANYDPLPAWMLTQGTNILTNGDFADFTGATPTGWGIIGDGTTTKELSIVDGASAYSVKLENGATAATRMSQTFSATPYRGQYLSLAVRIHIPGTPTPTNSTVGMIRLFSNQANYPDNYSDCGGAGGYDVFKWLLIPNVLINSDATTLGVYIYANANNTNAATVYIDRAVLVASRVPMDMA